MLYIKKNQKKIFAAVIVFLLSIYFLPLLYVFFAPLENDSPCNCLVCCVCNNSNWYFNYTSLLTGILGLNGLFAYFFTKREVEESRTLIGRNVLLSSESDFGNGKIFKSENGYLIVANHLHKMIGDNLWKEMNEWYEAHKSEYKNYPLINARENEWQGNDEWRKQLNDFVEYLRENNELDE